MAEKSARWQMVWFRKLHEEGDVPKIPKYKYVPNNVNKYMWNVYVLVLIRPLYFIASDEINVFPKWIKMIFSQMKECDIFDSKQ